MRKRYNSGKIDLAEAQLAKSETIYAFLGLPEYQVTLRAKGTYSALHEAFK
jgi:hypothetical protein